MIVTASELMRRFRAAMSEGAATYFTEQNAYDWLNEGQNEVYNDAPFTTEATWELDETAVPVGGSAFIAPDACGVPTAAAVRLAGGGLRRLRYAEPDRMDRLTSGSVVATGEPTWVSYGLADDGIVVRIHPAPSTSCSFYIRGYRVPRRMSVEASRLDLPEHLCAPVIFYAVWCAKGKDEESEQAREAERKFVGAMNKIAERRMDRQRDQHNTVRDGRGVARYPYTVGRW